MNFEDFKELYGRNGNRSGLVKDRLFNEHFPKIFNNEDDIAKAVELLTLATSYAGEDPEGAMYLVQIALNEKRPMPTAVFEQLFEMADTSAEKSGGRTVGAFIMKLAKFADRDESAENPDWRMDRVLGLTGHSGDYPILYALHHTAAEHNKSHPWLVDYAKMTAKKRLHLGNERENVVRILSEFSEPTSLDFRLAAETSLGIFGAGSSSDIFLYQANMLLKSQDLELDQQIMADLSNSLGNYSSADISVSMACHFVTLADKNPNLAEHKKQFFAALFTRQFFAAPEGSQKNLTKHIENATNSGRTETVSCAELALQNVTMVNAAVSREAALANLTAAAIPASAAPAG